MAVLDRCSLPSFSNDADGATGRPFEDIILLSLTDFTKNIGQKIALSYMMLGHGTKQIKFYSMGPPVYVTG